MIKRITKKHIQELTDLINKYGYWSEQVKEYNSQFEYGTMEILQQKVKLGKL